MKVAGLIFSNIHDGCIPEMTHFRTMASIPFGCRYRLIDFALSNMVNSGITNVGVITHYNYRSLLDHIGAGKDWDLSRRSGGIKIISPYVTAFENQLSGKMYQNRLEAIVGASSFIKRCGADYIVMSDCDVIMNIDLKKVVEDHVSSGAYITLVTKRVKREDISDKDLKEVKIGEKNKILDIVNCKKGEREVTMNTNVTVMSRLDLEELISDVLSHSYRDLTDDLFLKKLKNKLFCSWPFDGWYENISSLESYFKVSMKLLTPEAREGLFYSGGRRIYTKVRNSAPVKYSPLSEVKNSLIADGCKIEGQVENSILFRGVHVGKGAIVKNSILLQDTVVSDGAYVNCTVTDKNVTIKEARSLSGHETLPFFITKGTTV